MINDAYEYFIKHYKEFDFIWASPPCHTHTRIPSLKIKLPDLRLYELILTLAQFFKGFYVVENVIPHYAKYLKKNVDPYFTPFITPTAIVDRHYIWSNFPIEAKKFEKPRGNIKDMSKEDLCKHLSVDLNLILSFKCRAWRNHDAKRNILRNCVLPEAGKYIFDCIKNQKQLKLEVF